MSQQNYLHGAEMDISKVYFVLLVLALNQMQDCIVNGRPGGDLKFYDQEKLPEGCINDDKTNELCQKCAKHTKSSVVYPMCCRNEEDAQDFCLKFLTYGLQ